MAGVKITDLVAITEAASADLLYIVDVSNTTQSPEGTSSQIEVGNMFSSGTYTPTFSAYTNGIAVTPNSATYIKVASIVTVSAQLEIVLDTAQTTGTFEMSLPVASDFANQKNLFGLMQYSDMVEIVNATISAETTNNTCAIDIDVATAAIDMQYVNIQFQYEVL
jgi:hypothetical protein